MDVFETADLSLRWHGHSSVSLSMPGTRIYVDPFRLFGRWPSASYVLITHSHYDHLDPQSIEKIDDGDTQFVIPDSFCCHDLPIPGGRMIRLRPGDRFECPDRPLNFTAKPAYNLEKRFHPESEQWLGYVVETPESRIYHAGDTGPVPVNFSEPVDLALVPVDGIYTMTARKASAWVDELPVQQATPIHYNTIRGNRSDAVRFRRTLTEAEPVTLEPVRLTV